MSSLAFSGSIRPSPGTVHIIGTITNTGSYISHFDLGNVQAGDEGELKFNNAVGTGGTISLMYEAGFGPIRPASQVWASPPVAIVRSGHVSIKMTAGSPRWFEFDVILI